MKTYTTSTLLAAVGVYFLAGGPIPAEATFSNPNAAVGFIVGAVALLVGAATASLRHAIAKLGRR